MGRAREWFNRTLKKLNPFARRTKAPEPPPEKIDAELSEQTRMNLFRKLVTAVTPAKKKKRVPVCVHCRRRSMFLGRANMHHAATSHKCGWCGSTSYRTELIQL